MDKRRQVGSGRVCEKLSCCLRVPHSLSGWLMGVRLVVGLGSESQDYDSVVSSAGA